MKKFIKFTGGGIISYGIRIILTFILTDLLNMWYLFSYTFSTLLIILFGFLYNFYFVFKNIEARKNKLLVYTVSLILFSLVDILLVSIITDKFHVYYLLSIIISTSFLFMIKFVFYKKFLFVDYKKNIAGNYYPKHTTKNIIVRWLMDKYHNCLFMLIERVKPKTILDVGCGEGYTSEEIKKHFKDIYIEGSDVEKEIVDFAKKRNKKIKFSVESIYNLKRKKNSFDLVTSLEVLEHIDKPEKAIEEVKRVSKRYAIFSVPYEPLWRLVNMIRLAYLPQFGNTPGHINHWTKKGFERLLRKHYKYVLIKRCFIWNFALCWN